MKIYLTPIDTRHLVAVTAHPAEIVAEFKYSDALDEHTAVLMLRDKVREFPNGPHKMLWAPNPDAHPEVASALERLFAPPSNPTADAQNLCASCVHSRVCVTAREANNIGATINFCPEHVTLPEENP